MVNEAAKGETPEMQNVGEDSGFCDRLMAAGGRIYVDTDLVVGHVTKKIITPDDLKKHMDARAKRIRQVCGLTA
jgi:hypothetical protein